MLTYVFKRMMEDWVENPPGKKEMTVEEYVELKKEYHLIQQKKSKLSAMKRKNVVDVYESITDDKREIFETLELMKDGN